MKLEIGMALDAAAQRIVAEIPGWTPPEQLLALALLSATTGYLGGDIVEIGSWCGRTAVAMAVGLGQQPGKVHAIDPFPRRSEWRQLPDGTWTCSPERNGRRIEGDNPSIWDKPFQEDILPVYAAAGDDGIRATFDRSTKAFGVAERVAAHVGDSAHFARTAPPDLACRLAFLDGSHGYNDVCADLDVVERYLRPGAWVCFDDAFTVYQGVDKAIENRVLSGRYANGRQVTRKMFIAQWEG